MKKRTIMRLTIVVLVFVACAAFVMSCMKGANEAGWTYQLPNGYALFKDGLVFLTSKKTDSYILSYDINEAAIPCTREIKMASNGHYMGLVYVNESDVSNYTNGRQDECIRYWYVVDEIDDIVYGPYYSENEFNAALKEMDISDIGSWRFTNIAGGTGGVLCYITDFCYNDRYVGIKRHNTIGPETGVTTEEEWYILDGENDTLYGSYSSEKEYKAALLDLGVSDLGEWISTKKKPND